MKCPTCGFELNEKVSICPNCGAGMEDDSIRQATEQIESNEGWDTGEETFGAQAPEEPQPAPADEDSVVSPLPGDGGDLPPVEKKRRKWPIILALLLLAAALIAIFAVRYYKKHYIAHEIHLGTKSLELIVGDTAELTFEILPETTKNKTVTWETTDGAVASVDENGLVTALGSGDCEIIVSTNNGITDACSVNVKDLIDIQKESIEAVAAYIRQNSTEDENGAAVAKIRDIDEERSFALGSMDQDLVLCYRDAVDMDSVDVDVKYTTYLNLGYGNIETAEIVQDNQVEIFGYPVTATMRSAISLADYQRGASVAVDSFETNLEGMEVNPSMQKMFNNGVKGCFEEFRSFLEYHPELGCTIEDFGFTAVGDAPVEEEIVEDTTDDGMAESVAESVAESMPEPAESQVTIVEEIAEPAGTDSGVSAAEPEAAESTAEKAEYPVIIVPPVTSEAEEILTAAPAEEIPVESAAEVVESVVEDVADEAAALAGAAGEAVESVVEDVTEDAAALAGAAEDTVESVAEDVADEAAALAGAAGEAMESVVEDVTEDAAALAGTAGEAVESAAWDVTEDAAEAAEAAGDAVESFAEDVTEGAAALAGAAAEAVESFAENVSEGAAALIDAAEDMAESGMSDVESVVEDMEEPVTDLFDDAPASESSASSILQSLTESLSGDSGRLFTPTSLVMC